MELVICPTCGTANLHWLNDEKAADGFDYETDDDAVSHHYTCTKCGTDVIVIEQHCFTSLLLSCSASASRKWRLLLLVLLHCCLCSPF